jgi:hypothetical protein
MDRVHEAKPAPDEPTGDYKTEDAGGKSNKKLQHIECRHITERLGERFSSRLAPDLPGMWYANRRRYTERILA